MALQRLSQRNKKKFVSVRILKPIYMRIEDEMEIIEPGSIVRTNDRNLAADLARAHEFLEGDISQDLKIRGQKPQKKRGPGRPKKAAIPA